MCNITRGKVFRFTEFDGQFGISINIPPGVYVCTSTTNDELTVSPIVTQESQWGILVRSNFFHMRYDTIYSLDLIKELLGDKYIDLSTEYIIKEQDIDWLLVIYDFIMIPGLCSIIDDKLKEIKHGE